MMASSMRAVLLSIALLLLAGAPARGDTCCYSVCGMTMQPPLAILVTCETTACPRTAGRCTVWAKRQADVRCDRQRTCDAGPYTRRDAEAVIERLAADRSVVVVQPVTFKLRTGELIRFER